MARRVNGGRGRCCSRPRAASCCDSPTRCVGWMQHGPYPKPHAPLLFDLDERLSVAKDVPDNEVPLPDHATGYLFGSSIVATAGSDGALFGLRRRRLCYGTRHCNRCSNSSSVEPLSCATRCKGEQNGSPAADRSRAQHRASTRVEHQAFLLSRVLNCTGPVDSAEVRQRTIYCSLMQRLLGGA